MPYKLTNNEIRALRICLNYDNREQQLGDNFSNGGMEEFMNELNWNRHQASAIIGSLEQKGMGYSDDNDGNGNIFWLTEKGVNAIFDVIESGIYIP